MTHKAIIKCTRFDAEWYYSDKRDVIEEYKSKAIEKNNEKNYYSFRTLDMYESWWQTSIETHGVNSKLYETGMYALWEGEVNLELLSVGHYIFVEPLNEYMKITKVEVNTDGSAFYYIDYEKHFLNLREETRLNAIEKWLAAEYPHINTFEELKNHKDDICELKLDYQKYRDGFYNITEVKKDVKELEDVNSNTYEKPMYITGVSEDNEDFATMGVGCLVVLILGICIAILLMII